MTPKEKLNTHQRALRINLDPTSYGSFAEIGAGQEVVRWFLVVGGASGTVAKSISAYDKEVSDDLYGSGARYVSGERLQAMLESEWAQLINQLKRSRGSNASAMRHCARSWFWTIRRFTSATTVSLRTPNCRITSSREIPSPNSLFSPLMRSFKEHPKNFVANHPLLGEGLNEARRVKKSPKEKGRLVNSTPSPFI